MKVEIWSDVMCPFCYLGKHRFEKAMAQFEHSDKIQVEWKSFQLDPTLKGEVSKDAYFAKKGMPKEQLAGMFENMKAMAAQEGLVMDNEKTIISNTYKAHQLIQLAKDLKIQNEVEEILFEMYFSEGYNMEDSATIYEAAKRANIDENLVKAAIENDTHKAAFEKDIFEAQQFGINGVPFFIFDRKYAVNGAQSPEHFLGALQQSYQEWETAQPKLTVLNNMDASGPSCDINGNCD